jgi:antitoxin component YwqK of YwqJK toxin-antitoxin module
MKAILLSLAIALLMVGCGESSQPSEGVDMNDTDVVEDAIADAVDRSKLQDRNRVKYLPDEDTPFTGRAESFYENGQKELENNYKDGKPDGLFIQYNLDGTEWSRRTYKDGERVK